MARLVVFSLGKHASVCTHIILLFCNVYIIYIFCYINADLTIYLKMIAFFYCRSRCNDRVFIGRTHGKNITIIGGILVGI